MFRIELFCEDKDLAFVMHVLAGRAKNLNVQPVPEVNVQRLGGNKITPKSGNTLALIMEEIKRRKLETIRAADIRDIIGKLGYSPTSYQHFTKGLVKVGALAKHGKGQHMSYTVKS
jgi:hypothetical protein